MPELCQAQLPLRLPLEADGKVRVWALVCDNPATGIWRGACVHEHVSGRRALCEEHRPEPGTVGCRECFDAGHECPMLTELVEALT